MSYICSYCGKEIGNHGCLILHEKYCKNNPNRIISKTQSIREERDSRRDINGILRKKGHELSEETKQKISKSRKEWLIKNKDKHIWKHNLKFLSIPCENLKAYFRDKKIEFVEEYTPYKDINYCIDIAWPDEKIGIEVNGNQHYNNDGSLKPYYKHRHDILEERGWQIFEVHYTKCYSIDVKSFEDILKLPIYDKDYVGKYFSKHELSVQKKRNSKELKKQKQEIKKQRDEKRKAILKNLFENSNIDFSKRKWSSQALKYLQSRNECWDVKIFSCIKKYYPDFLKRNDVWKRKGSIY